MVCKARCVEWSLQPYHYEGWVRLLWAAGRKASSWNTFLWNKTRKTLCAIRCGKCKCCNKQTWTSCAARHCSKEWGANLPICVVGTTYPWNVSFEGSFAPCWCEIHTLGSGGNQEALALRPLVKFQSFGMAAIRPYSRRQPGQGSCHTAQMLTLLTVPISCQKLCGHCMQGSRWFIGMIDSWTHQGCQMIENSPFFVAKHVAMTWQGPFFNPGDLP